MPLESKRVNLRVGDRDFKYYIFDWDDNILHMPTRIHLEKRLPDNTWVPHVVSTSVFSLVRSDTAHYRLPQNNPDAAFVEFQDYANETESSFLRDTRLAITRILQAHEKPAPSFRTFRKSLIEGRLFAIVTARGHAVETIKKGVRLFIDLVLTETEREEMLANLRGYRACFDHRTSFGSDEEELEYYLALNHYHAVTSPDFKERMAHMSPNAPASSEDRKQYAIRAFVEHVIHVLAKTGVPESRRSISIGFSDDDAGNIAAAKRFLREEMARLYPGVKFCVYDTSDRTLEKGRKNVVSGQMDLGL